jgi:hypothetical protein
MTPWWILLLTPLLAFLGGLLGQLIGSRRDRTDQLWTQLRWAAELAVSDDESRRALGADQLGVLADLNLTADQQRFAAQAVSTALETTDARAEDTETVVLLEDGGIMRPEVDDSGPGGENADE